MELCYEGVEELNPYWDLQYSDGDGKISNEEPKGNDLFEYPWKKYCRHVVTPDVNDAFHPRMDTTDPNTDNNFNAPDSPVDEDDPSTSGTNQGTDTLSESEIYGRKVRKSMPRFYRRNFQVE